MSDLPDLAALREAIDTSVLTHNVKAIGIRVETANDLLAVLALVDTLQARVTLLEGVVEDAVEAARAEGAYRTASDWEAALSVSPAEKEQP